MVIYRDLIAKLSETFQNLRYKKKLSTLIGKITIVYYTSFQENKINGTCLSIRGKLQFSSAKILKFKVPDNMNPTSYSV